MMEGFQSRVSEPNNSALSDWIPVAACQPWAVRTYSSHSGGQHRHDLTASTFVQLDMCQGSRLSCSAGLEMHASRLRSQ